MVKALIFDMDGILIDSMPHHVKTINRVFGAVGIHLDEQTIYDMEGSRTVDIVTYILKHKNIDPQSMDIEGLLAQYQEEFKRTASFRPFDQIRAILPQLKGHFLISMVTGADRSIVRHIVDDFFPGIFDAVISGEDVSKGKPDPEPFLKAARMLEVDPTDCVVVENATKGVEAAKRAGMYCVAVPTYVSPDKLEKADRVFENHEDLAQYLLSLE
ncbi:HAD family hydrolase [Methanohalophilus euhalobius]|jgi:HAD superfamily hydrolase (TIGR01509 family)|uniref:HAD family phosphatase n=1 Tax=Methanohalophilus euhalobius TaxID=51203 RepID=A0A314ZY56_9EURY|nr:HAD family phosphatase [Methanohalophilus euhalobius]PQV42138.1 HAD superfamily hydrolase (TIGR01509 family) [Methanohalophilus euhalobius]RNI07225.1 HAD family phosphatase [Methanohalophilus euhalobius]RSD34124.1 MAG: HAD-superfamily hydrolase, subfamily IA, variant 3 [Methanohalophilus sp.]